MICRPCNRREHQHCDQEIHGGQYCQCTEGECSQYQPHQRERIISMEFQPLPTSINRSTTQADWDAEVLFLDSVIGQLRSNAGLAAVIDTVEDIPRGGRTNDNGGPIYPGYKQLGTRRSLIKRVCKARGYLDVKAYVRSDGTTSRLWLKADDRY